MAIEKYPSPRKLHVALVGLGFGAEFIPIYQAHPNIASVSLCDSNAEILRNNCQRFGISEAFTDLNDVLNADHIDAVHLITPIPLHGKQTIAVLRSGKHCACTVPMATSVEDIQAVIQAQKDSGKNYMMMETAVYTREYLMVKERFKRGEFGEISFARGGHMQDMEGWPDYWIGLPPHHYMTHAISPILNLLATRVKKVHCFGSGRLPAERHAQYNNPFPAETAIFRLVDSPVAVEVTRSLFQTVRPYSESFAIYGDKLGFEWQQVEENESMIFFMPDVGKIQHQPINHVAIAAPDRQDLLPAEIAPFTRAFVHDGGDHLSFVQGGGHSGSHPHLVHEFIDSIVKERAPAIDARTAANWTAPGIAAHESAMRDGEAILVPEFI